MICRDKRVFLDFLNGLSSVPVLFEPFLSHRHAETLIWRRGAHLWDEPREEIATLLSVTERTGSDFVWIDFRGRSAEQKRALRDGILSAKERESTIGFGVLGDSEQDAEFGEEAADAAIFGEQHRSVRQLAEALQEAGGKTEIAAAADDLIPEQENAKE